MRLQHALASVGLVGALALTAGCNASSGTSTSADPTATPPPSTSGPSSPANTATPVADPEHAVDPPGPRTGALTYADIMVSSDETLSDETIAAIQELGPEKVVAVEQISLARVSIENKLINVAAVDPATYRNFTYSGTAEEQAVWDRVAGGEIAVDGASSKRLPVDAQGFLRLGSDQDAPRIHVGAIGAQIEEAIDAVVNEKWGEALEMTPGNALLISTGSTAPVSLRKPLQRILGDGPTPQFVDAQARYDLKPGAKQTAVVVGTAAAAVGVFNYTVLGGGHIAPQPSWIATHIATQQVPILGSVTCNKLIFPQLTAALNDVIDRGLADKIHPGEYAGCYNARFIAGTTSLSNHSFGLALDLNVPGNQRGTVGEMDRDVVSIFKSWGFTWGGDWGYTDPMHFEMNALVDPR